MEGEIVSAPNPKKRRVRIPSIVRKRMEIKTNKQKGKAVSTKDLPFWQNRQKLAIKKGGHKKVKLYCNHWHKSPIDKPLTLHVAGVSDLLFSRYHKNFETILISVEKARREKKLVKLILTALFRR